MLAVLYTRFRSFCIKIKSDYRSSSCFRLAKTLNAATAGRLWYVGGFGRVLQGRIMLIRQADFVVNYIDDLNASFKRISATTLTRSQCTWLIIVLMGLIVTGTTYYSILTLLRKIVVYLQIRDSVINSQINRYLGIVVLHQI